MIFFSKNINASIQCADQNKTSILVQAYGADKGIKQILPPKNKYKYKSAHKRYTVMLAIRGLMFAYISSSKLTHSGLHSLFSISIENSNPHMA